MSLTSDQTATLATAPRALRSLPLRARTLAQYLAALALCMVVLGLVYDLRAEARKWPFAYRGDTMFYHLLAKSLIDDGWFLDVSLLGAPETLNLRDVPTSDNNLHVLLLWVLSLATPHYPAALNNFFLLGFVLVFLAAFVVLRHFGLSWWTSVCMSLLYAFAPFHIMRGEHHLFLSACWQVPLAVLVALWISGDGLWPGRDRHVSHAVVQAVAAAPAGWRSARVGASIGICLVLSATGFYYAFFACFFVFVAGLVGAARDRSCKPVAAALGLAALVTAGVCINLAPSLLHFQEHGTVPIVQRVPADADLYGLRIAQLLLPARGHVVEALDGLRAEYARRPFINENDDVTLGVAGALGFLGLLWWFFFRKPAAAGLSQRGALGLLHHLSIFNLAAVLFATIGGFGSLVAFFGLPQVRAYNRIGVFISFLVLFAVGLWVDQLALRCTATRARALALRLALGVATAIALYDQISPAGLPDYSRIKAQFASDSAFVQQIEQKVARGAQIFQLPFTPFPEAPYVRGMRDYDLLRGYLHSSHLRWSHGTIKGREGNAWLRQTSALPLDRLLERLVWAGFSGIYIDRNGFADGGAAIEAELEARVGILPVYSADRELVFYALDAYRARMEELTPRREWDAKREAALHPPLAVWREGFSDQEEGPQLSWRWGASRARLTLVNRASRPQAVRLAMSVTPNAGGYVTIRSPLFGEPVRVERGQPDVDRFIVLPPGEHDLHFASNAPRVFPPNDFRDLVFGVQNLELTPATASGAQAPASTGTHD